MANHYDVAVIGSGPGGYISAIRSSQLGLKTVCIEKVSHEDNPALGGTCLNVGCIPSKALLESSLNFLNVNKNFKDHGIDIRNASIDINLMHERKEKIVSSLTKGVSGLFKLNKIDTIEGEAFVSDLNNINIKSRDSTSSISANNIILATGSRPMELPGCPFDDEYLVSSNGALRFNAVPERIAVIGAGAIGLELGSVWSRLGSEVIILESLSNFLPQADDNISKEALKIFTKQGLKIFFNIEIKGMEVKNNEIEISLANAEEHQFIVDKVIIAIGRQPVSDGIINPNIGVELDENGFIKVDDFCQTQVNNIYAIGDLVRGPMLAHKASGEGLMVAEKIAGNDKRVNYGNIPFVIYTHPEIAWVGYSEKQALQEGFKVEVGSFPFQANGRALTSNQGSGFVKVVVNKEDDSILGIHVIGPSAADVVQQGLIAMDSNLSSKQLSSVMFSHPTVSEALHEAVLSARGNAIHLNNRKKK